MAPSEPRHRGALARGRIARRRSAGARSRLEPGRRRLGHFPRARHRLCARAPSGRVVATAATLPYGEFAWISMVLVAGEQRRRGLGTRLLRALHRRHLREQGCVPVLDATPAGRAALSRTGLRGDLGLSPAGARQRDAAAALEARPAARSSARSPTPTGPRCAPMTPHAFGADRSALLARLRGRLPPAELIARARRPHRRASARPQRPQRVADRAAGRGGR